MGVTHVLKEGSGYWETTFYPYGGDFHRAVCAFGVTLLPDRQGKYPDEAVVQVPGTAGPRTLIVKREALIPVSYPINQAGKP